MTKPRPSFTATCYLSAQLRGETQRGVTLIELLVAVAVMAILLPIGASSLGEAVTSMRLTSAANLLLSQIHYARSEAIKRNSRVVLCKSSNGGTCAAAGGWEQGWISFHDINNNGAREASEALIQSEAPLAGNLKFTGNQNVASYLSFAPSGATRLVGGGFQAGTLTLCRQSNEAGEGRQLILNAVGRPRIQRVVINSCA
jgi:type IV fimbrial biogenesis protein FimT